MSRNTVGGFCSEALISREVLLRAINLRYGTHDFTSLPNKVIFRIFMLTKNAPAPAGIELPTSHPVTSMITTGPPHIGIIRGFIWILKFLQFHPLWFPTSPLPLFMSFHILIHSRLSWLGIRDGLAHLQCLIISVGGARTMYSFIGLCVLGNIV